LINPPPSSHTHNKIIIVYYLSLRINIHESYSISVCILVYMCRIDTIIMKIIRILKIVASTVTSPCCCPQIAQRTKTLRKCFASLHGSKRKCTLVNFFPFKKNIIRESIRKEFTCMIMLIGLGYHLRVTFLI
jgi:hypothetical protein